MLYSVHRSDVYFVVVVVRKPLVTGARRLQGGRTAGASFQRVWRTHNVQNKLNARSKCGVLVQPLQSTHVQNLRTSHVVLAPCKTKTLQLFKNLFIFYFCDLEKMQGT